MKIIEKNLLQLFGEITVVTEEKEKDFARESVFWK